MVNLSDLKMIFRDHSEMLRAAFLFGSQVEGKAGPLSDYDFAILPREGYERGEGWLKLVSELLPILAEELGVSEGRIDLVALVDPLPDELWYRAILRGIPLYVEEGLLAELRLRALRFLDFKVMVEKLKLREVTLRSLRVRG
ncbi:MAG: nucleotidyltransferase domain-containing protein [Candidatus Korarchaeum sp.]